MWVGERDYTKTLIWPSKITIKQFHHLSTVRHRIYRYCASDLHSPWLRYPQICRDCPQSHHMTVDRRDHCRPMQIDDPLRPTPRRCEQILK